MSFKLIVAGTRTFNNKPLAFHKIAHLTSKQTDVEIVCGEARGADTLGKLYANNNLLKLTSFPAEWDRYGKAAGYIRNDAMAKYADGLLVFWDGKSRGTMHMIKLAYKHKLKVKIVKYKEHNEKV